MSNFFEYNDKIAFHPGYYIKEIIDYSGLTQEDFAKRLGTTPKNLSILVRGEQSLTVDLAMKLSRLTGTTINYWLNLQNGYDSLIAEFKSLEELEKEREVFSHIDYNYFKKNFNLPAHSRQTDEQIAEIRRFLNISSLTILKNPNLTVGYRAITSDFSQEDIIKTNIMMQIAINQALSKEASKFNKTKFNEAIDYALTLPKNDENSISLLAKTFEDAGVILIVLPELRGSKVVGATKKIGNKIMLLLSEDCSYPKAFWSSLFTEIGYIIYGHFGISLKNATVDNLVNQYKEGCLKATNNYK